MVFLVITFSIFVNWIGNPCNTFSWLWQSLHADLDDTVKEREDLKRQMGDYIIEVKRCQELLSAKVQMLHYS